MTRQEIIEKIEAEADHHWEKARVTKYDEKWVNTEVAIKLQWVLGLLRQTED